MKIVTTNNGCFKANNKPRASVERSVPSSSNSSKLLIKTL